MELATYLHPLSRYGMSGCIQPLILYDFIYCVALHLHILYKLNLNNLINKKSVYRITL